MSRWQLALWIGLLASMVPAQDGDPPATPAPDFAAAVAAYGNGNYAQAMKEFALLAEQEPDAGRRAVLHGNAGTAAARAELWGEAIWHLEAAWRVDPGEAHVRRNLEQVRALRGDAGDETPAFLETLSRIPLWMTEDAVSRMVGLLAAVAILLLTACRARWAGRRTAWAAVLIGLAAVGLALGSEAARARDARRAVVIGGAAVRAEPNPNGRVLFRLPAGAVVRDEEQRDAWRLIETLAGARGWAPVDRVRAAGS